MNKKGKQLLARSTWNGGVYHIYEEEYLNFPQDWDIMSQDEIRKHNNGASLDEKMELAEEQPAPEETPFDQLTYYELKEMLDSLGIGYKGNAKKSELIALLQQG